MVQTPQSAFLRASDPKDLPAFSGQTMVQKRIARKSFSYAMHAGSLVLNHRLARSAVFYGHGAAKEGFAFVCVASDRPGGGAKEIP